MRLARAIPVAILVFTVYIVFSGSATPYDLVTGIVSAIVVGLITANLVVSKPGKALNPVRWAWTIAYAIYYFLVAEVKAHIDVMKRIVSPSMPINPGIVRVPIDVKTDYALTTVANSITNTPGTVTVDVDRERGYLYVHWIDVKTTDPEEARKHISQVFEKFAKRIFDD